MSLVFMLVLINRTYVFYVYSPLPSLPLPLFLHPYLDSVGVKAAKAAPSIGASFAAGGGGGGETLRASVSVYF